MNKLPVEVIKKFKQFKLGDISISTITVSEIQYGIAKSTHPVKNQLRLDEFLAPLEILDYNEIAARTYGAIRFLLQKRGQPNGSLDLLIASHALSQNLILVTNNDKEFKRIENLKVENWTV